MISSGVNLRSAWRTSGLVIALGLIAVGCGSESTPDPGTGRGAQNGDLALSTSAWRPGDPATQAQASGVLREVSSNCLQLVEGSRSSALVWPADYSARRAVDDGIEVLGPAGEVVAKTGQRLRVGGGVAAVNGQPCTAGADDVFFIHDDLTAR